MSHVRTTTSAFFDRDYTSNINIESTFSSCLLSSFVVPLCIFNTQSCLADSA